MDEPRNESSWSHGARVLEAAWRMPASTRQDGSWEDLAARKPSKSSPRPKLREALASNPGMNSHEMPPPGLDEGLRGDHDRQMVEEEPVVDCSAANDNGQGMHRLARLRAQAAVVRTLAEHVDHCTSSRKAHWLTEQLIEEMARLGCRILEVAASMAREHGFR
jgi:hypothetical protein